MLEGASEMGDLFVHRFQFAFTVVYHYLFPQLTMGLALLIVLMKARGLRPDGERWNDAARFWIRIFGINFAVGVGTGISMEFQFGTNWARFSRYAGAGQSPLDCAARPSVEPLLAGVRRMVRQGRQGVGSQERRPGPGRPYSSSRAARPHRRGVRGRIGSRRHLLREHHPHRSLSQESRRFD